MRILLSILFIAFAGSAQAAPVTIDFDSTLPTYFGLDTYQEDGFTLTSNVPDGTLIDVNNVVRGNLFVFSGGTNSQSLFWGENGTTSTISIASTGGAIFDLLAFDASSVASASGTLTVTGNLSGGGTVQQIVAVNGTLSTYNLSGLTGLSSVDISFDGTVDAAPFDLDNIQLSAIPVPAAIWLFASGLLGIVGLGRRSRLRG